MRLLQHERSLGRAFGHPEQDPVLLVWGVPVPNDCAAGGILRGKLMYILKSRLQEDANGLTEPDIILDFGNDGLVIVEAKVFSNNETKPPDYPHWPRYLNELAFRDSQRARATGRYQLVRNWRLGTELAADRPFTLINLAPSFSREERRALAGLRLAFRISRNHLFVLRRWSSLLTSVNAPDWFKEYAYRRNLHFLSERRSDSPGD